MRTTLIALLCLVLAVIGFGYSHNPSGFVRTLQDLVTIIRGDKTAPDGPAPRAKFARDIVAIYTSSSDQAAKLEANDPASSASPAPPVTTAPANSTSSPAPSTASLPPIAPALVPPPATAPSPQVEPVAVTSPPPTPAAPSPDSPPPVKRITLWTPPDVMPAQPNWTWTTLEGTTYQNVVVTDIQPDSVAITHSLGVTHIAMTDLPADIQKQLNYDPDAAAASLAEKKREDEHPYYRIDAVAEAKDAANRLQWPLAWVWSSLDYKRVDPNTNDWAGLTQLALDQLKTQAVIIFVDGNSEGGALPAPVRDQFFQLDDGPVPGGHHFYPPKIVFSSPDGTKTFGRVWYTQFKSERGTAIADALSAIGKNPEAQTILHPAQEAVTSVPVSTPLPPAPAPVPSPSQPLTPSSPPPAQKTASSSATNAPPEVKTWAPPDVIPAKPNWTWTTIEGDTYENVVITDIKPDSVAITHSRGVAHLKISSLPDDVQKALNYDPGAADQVSALVDGKLISADGSAFSLPTDAPVRYFAIYYSASWCPPCHAFTPTLVQWYNKFKPKHREFELIFVSEDYNERDMFGYMKEMSMPWPAVRYTELLHDGNSKGTFQGSGIEKFANHGIPDLVFVDADGNVLADSYRDGTYVGPGPVVDDIEKQIGP